MGVTDPSMLTEAAQRNWVKAVEKEIEARYSWHERWGWMPAVIEETSQRLRELKHRQSARLLEQSYEEKIPERNPAPFPRSTNHEYGWLVTKPEYQLESYGPWPNNRRQRIEPTSEEIERAAASSGEKVRGAGQGAVKSPQESSEKSLGSGSQTVLSSRDEGEDETEIDSQNKGGAEKEKDKSKKIKCCINY